MNNPHALEQTLLVVDDSAVMRQMISAMLEGAGYRVLLADGGEAALAHARSTPVQLVLTDWTMIPMDGGQLTRALRQLPGLAHTPVLVLSTISSDAGKAEARAAGASGWLCKPVHPPTLLDVLQTMLARPAA
jgi:two-component system chemotaxis response regulator CheY